MTRGRGSLAFLFLLLLGLSTILLPLGVHSRPAGERVPGVILVKFKSGTPRAEIEAVHRENEGIALRAIQALDVEVVRVPPGSETAKVEAYKRNPRIEYAAENGVVRAAWIPNDPYFPFQYQYVNNGQPGYTPDADVDADWAWSITRGSSAVKIAVLDTGVYAEHEDLSGKVVVARDFAESGSGPTDLHGHGTHVAGLVAANTDNGKGVAGTCPDCRLLNGKVLDDGGNGTDAALAEGIVWAADEGARVVNLSLSARGVPDEPECPRVIEDAIGYASTKGVLVVAAAGNFGESVPSYPAYCTQTVAVAATDGRDRKASFSNYGVDWVDVAAPGVSLYSTARTGSYVQMSGTSMSTPIVSGIAGLIFSHNPALSVSQVRQLLEGNADRIAGTGTFWAHGRVNAYNALNPSGPIRTLLPLVTKP